MEQTVGYCHRGNNHEPTHDTPRSEQPHIPHTGEFHSTLHSLFYPFHLRDLSTGAFVQIEVQIQKPTSKNNPHLFPLHHSHIEPTPSQTHRYYFLICKNLEPPSYKQTSISKYHPTYTKNKSRENLSHQQPR